MTIKLVIVNDENKSSEKFIKELKIILEKSNGMFNRLNSIENKLNKTSNK